MRFFFLFCLLWTSLRADIAYFKPPKNWEVVDPKLLSPDVKAMFRGAPENSFAPSINLAIEETDATQKEYFKSVKEFQQSNAGQTWRDLGPLSVQAGDGRLTEITCPSPVGDIKMLQSILVKGKKAYILTAACLKAHFLQHQAEFLAAIKSLSLAPDFASTVPDPQERLKLETALAALGEQSIEQDLRWTSWQKIVLEDFEKMGSHWHFLVLQEGWKRIHPQETEAK